MVKSLKIGAFYYLMFVSIGVIWRAIDSQGFTVSQLPQIMIPGLFAALFFAWFLHGETKSEVSKDKRAGKGV
jgi:hypothetical protein